MDELSQRYLSLAVMSVPQVEVDQGIQKVLSRIAHDRFRRSTARLDLGRIYNIDPPRGGSHLFKLVIYTPQQVPTVSVLVTNVADGWNSLCHLLAKEHNQFQLQAISTKSGAVYPKHRIEIWNSGRSVRIVMAIRDSDNWEFFQRGEPLAFEEKELYENRAIRKRIDRAIIKRYFARIGWDLSGQTFWESNTEAVFFEETSKGVGS